MTLVKDAGSKLIAQFPVPYKGTWSSVAANQIAVDALYDSLNIFIREGKIRQRPGLTLLNNTTFDSAVLGGAMAVTPTDKVLLAVDKGKFYILKSTDTAWLVDTVGTFASSDDSVVDITFLETSSQYVAVVASEGYQLKRWIQGTSPTETITAVNGTVPSAKSVCTCARRIVALVPPHTVVWPAILTYDNWPALAQAKIAQTNDVGICVRSLSNLSFVLYKERSIYPARAQAGTDATAFTFSEPIIVEGPAGIKAVIDVGGSHVYMTRNGRVAVFNGSNYPQWIADGLWLFLQSDIDPVYAHKIFGVFDYRLHTVAFVYPKIGDNGVMKGLVLINLPLEGSGVEGYAVFKGTLSKPCSHAYEMRFNNQIDRSLLFTSTAGDVQSVIFDENAISDDGTNFDCLMQTGLFPLPDMMHYYVSVEGFFERADGNGGVEVYAVVSDALENKTGIISLSDYSVIDLNNNPVREYIGFMIPSRFFGLRYKWTSVSKVRYAGTAVYGRVLS